MREKSIRKLLYLDFLQRSDVVKVIQFIKEDAGFGDEIVILAFNMDYHWQMVLHKNEWFKEDLDFFMDFYHSKQDKISNEAFGKDELMLMMKVSFREFEDVIYSMLRVFDFLVFMNPRPGATWEDFENRYSGFSFSSKYGPKRWQKYASDVIQIDARHGSLVCYSDLG